MKDGEIHVGSLFYHRTTLENDQCVSGQIRGKIPNPTIKKSLVMAEAGLRWLYGELSGVVPYRRPYPKM